ncbi:MAG: glycosyltransferase [Hyphomicrobiales bacterium]|nr:MAG: glycosyltransferase [Hyphomicrobiales bacterium]
MKSAVEAERQGNPRIAVVTKKLGRGGTEMHLLRVLPRLIENGIDVRLYLLQRGGILEDDFARAGIPLSGPQETRSRLLNVARSAVGLVRFLRAFEPDAVHYFLPEPYLIGSAVSPFAGAPLRLMSRRSLAVYQSKYPLVAQAERWAHRGTAALLGNAQAVVSELIAETGDTRKVGLIANGVPEPSLAGASEPSAMRSDLGIPPEAFVIAIVANLIPYKGHADLLAALARVKERLPRPWRLLAVGRDDGILADLRQQAAKLGLADNILWLGERRDVPVLLRLAQMAVLASHEEGSPNSVIEAMLCGLPVVATAAGGTVDIVETGAAETGILVPPRDPAALGEAIAAVAGSPPRREAMAQRAKMRAAERFSLSACVERYLKLYRNLESLAEHPVQHVLDTPLDAPNASRTPCASRRHPQENPHP